MLVSFLHPDLSEEEHRVSTADMSAMCFNSMVTACAPGCSSVSALEDPPGKSQVPAQKTRNRELALNSLQRLWQSFSISI